MLKPDTTEKDKTFAEWLERLNFLIDDVESWARELGWATRRIQKRMDDGPAGEYHAPALLLQEETARVILEPITHAAPGADGVVDLYLMPRYEDIATLLLTDGDWHLHYLFAGDGATLHIDETDARPFSRDALRDVLEEMRAHAA